MRVNAVAPGVIQTEIVSMQALQRIGQAKT
jgi:hypothetical protein